MCEKSNRKRKKKIFLDKRENCFKKFCGPSNRIKWNIEKTIVCEKKLIKTKTRVDPLSGTCVKNFKLLENFI